MKIKKIGKFKVNPKKIYQTSVRLTKDREPVIDVDIKYLGKKVTVIIDKEDAEIPKKEWERMADEYFDKT